MAGSKRRRIRNSIVYLRTEWTQYVADLWFSLLYRTGQERLDSGPWWLPMSVPYPQDVPTASDTKLIVTDLVEALRAEILPKLGSLESRTDRLEALIWARPNKSIAETLKELQLEQLDNSGPPSSHRPTVGVVGVETHIIKHGKCDSCGFMTAEGLGQQ